MEKTETKVFKILGRKFTFLCYGDQWVIPIISCYTDGLGCPVAMLLYTLTNGELELYNCVTVNLPNCNRTAGCQFIDTNNNDIGIVDWLEQNGLGIRTGNIGMSGMCKYPEFDFYKGEKFWESRKESEELLRKLKL